MADPGAPAAGADTEFGGHRCCRLAHTDKGDSAGTKLRRIGAWQKPSIKPLNEVTETSNQTVGQVKLVTYRCSRPNRRPPPW